MKKQESSARSQNFFKQWEEELYAGKTIGQLAKVRTPRRLKKNWVDELRKLAIANIGLHLVLIKMSEQNLDDKDVFPQVWIDVF